MTERRHSMMNLGHGQRQKVKIEFTICIKQVLGLPKSTTGNLFISWKRGSKKENSGETKHAPVKDQIAIFEFSFPLICTLYQEPKKGFEEKSVVFTLKEEGKSKKPSTLGKLAIDLAEFANSKTERIRTFTIKDKKTPIANITLSFKTSWLKMDGKTLVRADQAEHSGKEKVNIDGNDYYLQTEDELSVDETDQKSGNDSDEEAVDFDEDSEKEGGPHPGKSPNARRRSITPVDPTNVSTLLSTKTASPATPQSAATLSPTPAPAPTPTPATSTPVSTSTPPTPSTPPSIHVSSPGSDDPPKVLKYKKKLKHSRHELELARAELAKRDEQLQLAQSAVPKEDPAAAENAAKLAALLETEALLRKEIDEANRKLIEAQTISDAHKKDEEDARTQLDVKTKQFEEELRKRDAAAQDAESKLRELERAVSESASKNDKGSQEFEAKVREFEAKIAELEGQRKIAEDAAKAAEQRVRELEGLEEKVKSADEVAKENEKKIQELEEALTAQIRKNEEWEKKVVQDEENAKAAATINSEMTRVLESLESKIAVLQRSADEHESHEKTEGAKLLEEIERLETENGDIETENENLQAKIKELEERQKTAESELNDRIAQLEAALATTISRADKAEKDAEDLQKQNAELENKWKDENQKLQKRAAFLEAQLAVEAEKGKTVEELKEKNEELEEQISKLQATSDTQNKEIARLTALQAELEAEKVQMNAVKSQAELTERQKKQLEEELERLNEKISSLEAQVQAGAGEEAALVAELQNKNTKAEKEITSLKSQLEEAELAKTNTQSELEKVLAEKDQQSQNAQDAAAQISELEEELAKHKKKAKKAAAQALELEKQLDELKLQQQNGSVDDAEKYKELQEQLRAALERNEELEDETDRLKKREIVLGELNETTEKRIAELEAELQENQNKSAATATNDEMFAKLQKDLESAQAEAAQLKSRVRELEEAKAQVQASAAPSAGGASTEEVARLQREVEDYKKVEKAIYWDEIGFTAADISKTATAVWQLLAATRELDAQARAQDALTPLAQKVITALDKSYRRTQKDDKQVAYWLACSCSLLHFIHQRDDIPPSADPVQQGVQVDRDQFINGSTHAAQFGKAVQELTLNIYTQLISNLQESFQKVIIPAFLHEDLAVMDAQRTPTRGSSHVALNPNGVHSSPSSSSPSHSHSHPSPPASLTQLTNALTNILTILRDARCPAAVVKQIFHQLLHFISGCVLNALLYGKEVSTATHGLRIKLAVSRIDEWLAKQDSDVSGAGERLNLLRDAANVLVLDKSLFLDADTITSIFHSLNLVQVRKLLDLFQPDAVSPANVPQSVKQMMDTYWGYSPHNMPLVVDVTSLVCVN